MADSFVPLMSLNAPIREAAFKSLPTKMAAGSISATLVNGPSSPAASAHETCVKPVVTLQRTGETVSGIRIQCGCGQVIELTCVY